MIAGTARQRAGRRVGVLALAAGSAVALGLGWPGDAWGAMSCSRDGAKLTIEVPGSRPIAHVARERDEIVVSNGPLDRPASCTGGASSVLNTDKVKIRGGHPDVGLVLLDMEDGPFAPGASNEGDGSSEIEFSVRLSGVVELFVLGTVTDDHFGFGSDSGHLAANLNSWEAVPDIDLVVTERAFPVASGFGGDDTMTANGGREFSAPWSGATFSGHEGSDALVGGPGGDSLDGGHGPDRLAAKGGSDRIDALRDGRDRVRCGGGLDLRALVDPSDDVRGCELVKLGGGNRAGR